MTSSTIAAASMASLKQQQRQQQEHITEGDDDEDDGEGHRNKVTMRRGKTSAKSTEERITRTLLYDSVDPITDILKSHAADDNSTEKTTTATATKQKSPRPKVKAYEPPSLNRSRKNSENSDSLSPTTHTYPFQFQRSGSMRVRGTKSNLSQQELSLKNNIGGGSISTRNTSARSSTNNLSGNELEKGCPKESRNNEKITNTATISTTNSCGSVERLNTISRENNETTPPGSTTRRRSALRAANVVMKQHEVTHTMESPTILHRSFSPRRKLFLNNSHSLIPSQRSAYTHHLEKQPEQQQQQQQQQPLEHHSARKFIAEQRFAAQLRRSQSLRRNYKVPVYGSSSSNQTLNQRKFGNVEGNCCQKLSNGGGRVHNENDGDTVTAAAAENCNNGNSNSLIARIDAELANHGNEKTPNGLSPQPSVGKTSPTAVAATTGPPQRPSTLTTNGAGGVGGTVSTPRTPSTPGAINSSGGCGGGSGASHRTKTGNGTGNGNGNGNGQRRVVITPRTPPVTPDTVSSTAYLLNGLDEDEDIDSMYSFATTTSGRSTMSCEHPYVARNGTTFSGRKMKYVVHCSAYAGQVGADYLTPTQRAARQIRRLKELLYAARLELEQKDTEMLRLTREVVELRLFKASLSSPEERSASSDGAVTVREAELKTSQDVSPIVDDEMVSMAVAATGAAGTGVATTTATSTSLCKSNHGSPRHVILSQSGIGIMPSHVMQLSAEMQHSYADSGHYEEDSMHSKDSFDGGHSPVALPETHDIACGSDEAVAALDDDVLVHDDAINGVSTAEAYETQRQALIQMYEQRIEELLRTHDASTSDLRRTHNDKVEALLQKLAECNTRYADIVPDYEHAKERIRELERQLEELQRRLADHEDKQNKMYLHMYQQGQEAERIARADQALELAHRANNSKVSINELLQQLQSTQDELENIRAAECRMNECGGNHALLTAKEAISLWVLGARKTIYRRLLDAQKNRTHVDPEITLQFLKSAIYYFLTDKENSQGHLQAIESILEFTEKEKQSITKARAAK